MPDPSRVKRAAELRELTAGIAEALAGNWLVEPPGPDTADCRFCYLAGPGGARLLLETDVYATDYIQRVEIRGLFTAYGPRWEEHPRITCAASRGAEAIARDIARRLLPVYTTQLETAQRRIAERDVQRAALAHRAARVRELMGEEHLYVSSHMNDEDRARYSFADADLTGHVELRSAGRVCDLELRSLPYETALLLLAALARRHTLVAGVAA